MKSARAFPLLLILFVIAILVAILVAVRPFTPMTEVSPVFSPSGLDAVKPAGSPSPVDSKRVQPRADRPAPALRNPVIAPAGSRDEGVVEFKVVNGLAIAQGDLLLGSTDEVLPGGKGHSEAAPVRFWETPEIPYSIHPEIPEPQRQKIEKAIAYLKQKTPVHLIPYEGQRDAIIFEAGNEHCISVLGKAGGLQPIRLDRDCGTQEVLHEIMHSLGFPHEQSRRDRDQYVEILWPNIEERYRDQYSVLPEIWMEAFRGSRFDTHSIMMYRTDTFSTHPGLATMKSLTADPIQPVADGLSAEDILRLGRLFKTN
ncbi:MAG: hypothetical protein H7222_00310 [Methylotenera sp.]|nr:hypothetical protein [Oligoflexia bacterium]